jgi:hypothetical protein
MLMLMISYKAQTDAQHLWFGRRATTRVRSELMAAIYDKALKRKDFSGIIDKDKKEEAVEKKAAASNGSSTTAGELQSFDISASETALFEYGRQE